MEKIKPQDSETYLRRNLGMILIKPDAVELGVVEEIINFAAESVYNAKIGNINGVYILQLEKDQITAIYSTVKEEIGDILKDYMIEDVSVLTTFKGNGKDDLWDYLHKIRGKRLMDRSAAELDNQGGMLTGIRDIIPLPGTRKQYEQAFKKLKARIDNSNIPFEDEEYKIYCRNLVHVPDDVAEIFALLKLLSKRQIRENLSYSTYRLSSQINNKNA